MHCMAIVLSAIEIKCIKQYLRANQIDKSSSIKGKRHCTLYPSRIELKLSFRNHFQKYLIKNLSKCRR